MSNFFTRLFKKKPMSDLAFKCTLESLKSNTRLRIVQRDGLEVIGLFIRAEGSELVVKTNEKFVGIHKADVADIVIVEDFAPRDQSHQQHKEDVPVGSPKTQARYDVDSALQSVDSDMQERLVAELRKNPNVDPPLDQTIIEAAENGSAKAERKLSRFYGKYKWIGYYDGRVMKCPKLAKYISIPKATKEHLQTKGYYLCSIYAIKGKIPPILVLSNYEFVSEIMISIPIAAEQSEQDDESTEQPITTLDKDAKAPARNKKLKMSVLLKMRQYFFARVCLSPGYCWFKVKRSRF